MSRWAVCPFKHKAVLHAAQPLQSRPACDSVAYIFVLLRGCLAVCLSVCGWLQRRLPGQ
jgi:hypothetical protein